MGVAGAGHGAEIQMVWGDLRHLNATEVNMSRNIVQWWQQFSRESAPGGAGGVNWPAFGKDNSTLLLRPQSVTENVRGEVCDFWDSIHPLPTATGHKQLDTSAASARLVVI